MPKYPVRVKMIGEDGNAFAILGRVNRALRKHLSASEHDLVEIDDELSSFKEEATSGDYDNLLRVCMAWVEVD